MFFIFRSVNIAKLTLKKKIKIFQMHYYVYFANCIVVVYIFEMHCYVYFGDAIVVAMYILLLFVLFFPAEITCLTCLFVYLLL